MRLLDGHRLSGTTQTGNTLRVTFNGLSTGDGTFTVHSTNNAGLDSTDGIYSATPDPDRRRAAA